MCVIMVIDKVRPTEEMIERAFRANDDGGGVAWRGDGDGKVHWNKGLTVDQMKELIAEKPLPLVAHFRRESCGGKLASLTHPFPIDSKGSNYINGHSGGEVLFHNGHWGKWKETMFEVCIKFGKKIPDGKFSDTRAMAFIGGIVGKNFFDFIDEKVVIFGPETLEMTSPGSGWTNINGVLCSNGAFMTGPHRYTTGFHDAGRSGPTCKGSRCYVSLNLNADGYCAFCERQRVREANGTTYPFTQRTSGNNGGTTPKEDPTTGGTTPKLLGDGGASSESPFASMRAAERLYSQGKISHNFLKKMRKWFTDLPPIQQQQVTTPQPPPTTTVTQAEIVH